MDPYKYRPSSAFNSPFWTTNSGQQLSFLKFPDMVHALKPNAVSPAHALGGSSSTIAVIYGSATVCGIVAEQTTRRIQCWRNDQLIEISPAISFDYIAGGRDNFCGVESSWLCSPLLGLHFHLQENLQQQFGALTTPHIWG